MGWLDGRRPAAPFSPRTPRESSGLSPGPRGREGATLGFSGSEPHVKKGGKRYCHGHSKLIAIVVAQKTRNRRRASGLRLSMSGPTPRQKGSGLLWRRAVGWERSPIDLLLSKQNLQHEAQKELWSLFV